MAGEFFDAAIAAVEKPVHFRQPSEDGSFWRKSEPVLDDAGVIVKGGLWAHQRAWWDLPNFIKVLVGGYGAGKTLCHAKRVIGAALENAPAPVASISPTYGMARQTTIATIAALLAGKRTNYGREFRYRYNSTNHEFKIWFRGREALILCYSGEKPDSLRGPNLAAAYIDEPFLMDREVFDQMVARVRHPAARFREIGLTGTPEQLNWGYDLCVGELSKRHDVGMIRASTRQNRALDPKYTNRLENSFSGKAASAFIEGEFVNLSIGAVYHSFDPNVNVKAFQPFNPAGTRELIPPGAELGCGMDFNVNPMSAVVFWTLGDHMHVIEEFELENADTEFMCSTLRDTYGQHLTTIYPDASGSFRKTSSPNGRSDFWYIQNAGYNIDAPHDNPARRDRYNAVCGKFKSRSGRVSLTISPLCTKLIKSLSIYTYEQMHKQESLSHLLDAFGYPVHRLFPINKEIISIHRLSGV